MGTLSALLVACAMLGAAAVCAAQTQRSPAAPAGSGRGGFGGGFWRGQFAPPVPPEVAMPRPILEEVNKINLIKL
jgi:hypothetical protein